MAPELRIRRLRPPDLDTIFTAWGRQHGERWLERQERAQVYVAVAELDGEPVGRILLDLVRCADDGAAHIASAHVEPPHQSRGIGSALMLHLEAIARKRGFTSVRLAVAKDNDRARSLYERLGYEVVGEEINRWSYPDGGRVVEVAEDCWTMAKPLWA